ncbi:hypothetical protein BGZ82_003237, partial [Podila clonocystis]
MELTSSQPVPEIQHLYESRAQLHRLVGSDRLCHPYYYQVVANLLYFHEKLLEALDDLGTRMTTTLLLNSLEKENKSSGRDSDGPERPNQSYTSRHGQTLGLLPRDLFI